MTELTREMHDGIVTFWLDDPDAKVNTLRPELVERISAELEAARNDASVKGILIASRKQGQFIAGVDINLFKDFTSVQQVSELTQAGQQVLDTIATFPKPIVACIDGACMGGGTELSLACRYRVVSTSSKTSIALPEVRLGLLPGLGGTQRLPRRIGLRRALPHLLTGSSMSAFQAKRNGFADVATAPEYVLEAGRQLINGRLRGARVGLAERFLRWMEAHTPLRWLILRIARNGVLKATHGAYPAPLAIVDVVGYGLRKGLVKGLSREGTAFARLAMTPESKALIRLFFAMTDAKTNPFSSEGSSDSRVRSLGIVGSGLMGAGIAEVSALNGYHVTAYDQREEALRHTRSQLGDTLARRRSRRRLNQRESDTVASRLHTTAREEDLADSEMIIEAIVEKLEVKQELFQRLEKGVPPGTILSSNTSSLPISEIFKGVQHPENVLGMHYFSPVQKMPLLEIIRTPHTSRDTLRKAYDVGLAQGKTVIVVGDGPGFYTTRILAPFMNEAMLLFQEGADITAMDRLMKRAGFPVGPFTLMDEVGIDVGAHVGEVLGTYMTDRDLEMSPIGERMFKAGLLGRKAGKGFYLYGGKKKQVNPEAMALRDQGATRGEGNGRGRGATSAIGNVAGAFSVPERDCTDRLMYMMVNEAVRCLQEGILASPTDGDLGAIMGLGFPPFLGGPFAWLDSIGPADAVARMQELAQAYGERFTPATLLVEKGAQAGYFHDR